MGARRDPPRPLPANRIGQRPSPRILRLKTLPGLQPISAGSLPTTRRVSKRRALMTTADTLWSSSASLSPEVHLPAPPVERAPASLVIARRTARRGCPPSQRSDGGRGGGAPAVRRGSPEWGMGPEIRAPARPRRTRPRLPLGPGRRVVIRERGGLAAPRRRLEPEGTSLSSTPREHDCSRRRLENPAPSAYSA